MKGPRIAGEIMQKQESGKSNLKFSDLKVTQGKFAKATGTKDKEMFKIDCATHIETYWVPKYVDAAMNKLTAFHARTL
jgi:hypothetical protein